MGQAVNQVVFNDPLDALGQVFSRLAIPGRPQTGLFRCQFQIKRGATRSIKGVQYNVYLQILYEMGAIGLLAYAWLIVSIVRCLRRGRRYDANGVVMIYTLVGAYLLESYSDNMIYYLSFNWYFMFAIGTICAWIVYQEGPDRPAGRLSVRGPRPVSRPFPANADS